MKKRVFYVVEGNDIKWAFRRNAQNGHGEIRRKEDAKFVSSVVTILAYVTVNAWNCLLLSIILCEGYPNEMFEYKLLFLRYISG